jgi:hypothetical protein
MYDFELDLFAFLKALISIGSHRAVVNEYIRSAFTPNESETL